jgi:hypothetical protein
VIGKFGVGLKDALATLDRRGINVLIRSKFGDITPGLLPKHGFSDVKTPHAIFHPPEDSSLAGTDVLLHVVSDGNIADTLGKSSIQMELPCSACTCGAPTSIPH